jgi:small subunit ribosomal protein S1
MSWNEPSDFERRLLDDVSRRWPDLLDLARLLALATRIEPLLLRNVRLHFLGDADTELESLLWFSPLVSARSSRDIVFHPGTARLLADQLKAKDAHRFTTAWDFTRIHTRHWSPEDRLEQDLRYFALEHLQADLQRGLRDMLRRIQQEADADRRLQLARWVRQSLPQVMGRGTAEEEAQLLAQYASHVLGATASWSDLSSPQTLPAWLAAKLPEPSRTASLAVEVRYEPGRLVLHCLAAAGQSNVIEFPTPLPAKLFVQAEGRVGAWQVMAVGSRLALPGDVRHIRLTTIAGQQYELEAELPTDLAATPEPAARPLFLGHVSQDHELASRIAAWLRAQGLTVEMLDEEAARLAGRQESAIADARLLRLWSPAAQHYWHEKSEEKDHPAPASALLRIEGTSPPASGSGADLILDWPAMLAVDAPQPVAQRLLERLQAWIAGRTPGQTRSYTQQGNTTNTLVTEVNKTPDHESPSSLAWLDLEQAMQEGRTVKGRIDGKVKGGLAVTINGIRAFLPGSLVDVRPIKDTTPYENKDSEFKVIKLDRKRNNVVVSRKALLEASMGAEHESLLSNLKEGATVKGIVKNITEYGAFVDLGGIDGLLHITDLAWRRVKHPSEVVNVGDEVTALVLIIDRKKKRVALGLKQLSDDPWLGLSRRYPTGTRMFGRVANLTDYGCFVEIEPSIEGFVHVSEISWTDKNVNPSKVLALGDEVEVMVLEIDEDRRRISLGIKQCTDNPWKWFAATFKKGDRMRGQIKSITDFGIFIGLPGGIDGLVLPSDLSWSLPGDVALRNYRKGEEVEAAVLAIDVDKERISLGIKQLESDPFHSYVSTHDKGSIVTGTVKSMDAKGAVIQLSKEVEGYLRASEVSPEHVKDIRTHLTDGETVQTVIINIDRKNRQIILSIKAKDSHGKLQALRKLTSTENRFTSTEMDSFFNEDNVNHDEHTFGGTWTVTKLEALEKYLGAFNVALSRQEFTRIYLDAFAGTGRITIKHNQEDTVIDGSARRALGVKPGFHRYYFIDLKKRNFDALQELAREYPDKEINLTLGDANTALTDIIEKLDWRNTRAVLFLDPYGLHVEWKTLEAIAGTQAIDVWYLFPFSGLYRQAAMDADAMDAGKIEAITRLLGTSEWRQRLYAPRRQADLFGNPGGDEREADHNELLDYVSERLRTLFPAVSKPKVLYQGGDSTNPKGAPLFALYFAAANPSPKAYGLALKIAQDVLKAL